MTTGNQAHADLEAYTAEHRADLERDHHGRYALFFDCELVGIHRTFEAAFCDGRERFQDQHFSVIHVGHTEIHLGVSLAPVVGPVRGRVPPMPAEEPWALLEDDARDQRVVAFDGDRAAAIAISSSQQTSPTRRWPRWRSRRPAEKHRPQFWPA